jgi:hypothetical protein
LPDEGDTTARQREDTSELGEMSPRQELAMMSNQMSRLQEQLVDLYLSVKIRSNDEVRATHSLIAPYR